MTPALFNCRTRKNSGYVLIEISLILLILASVMMAWFYFLATTKKLTNRKNIINSIQIYTNIAEIYSLTNLKTIQAAVINGGYISYTNQQMAATFDNFNLNYANESSCAIFTYNNTSNQIQGFLVYQSPIDNLKLNSLYSGRYSNASIVALNNSWNYSLGFNLPAIVCDNLSVADSYFIDLNRYNNYVSYNQVGSIIRNNPSKINYANLISYYYNHLKTDLVFSANTSLIFESNATTINLYVESTTSNSLSESGGGLISPFLASESNQTIGAICSSTTVGSYYTNSQPNESMVSTLQCNYSPGFCNILTNGASSYCITPTNYVKTSTTLASNTTNYICPATSSPFTPFATGYTESNGYYTFSAVGKTQCATGVPSTTLNNLTWTLSGPTNLFGLTVTPIAETYTTHNYPIGYTLTDSNPAVFNNHYCSAVCTYFNMQQVANSPGCPTATACYCNKTGQPNSEVFQMEQQGTYSPATLAQVSCDNGIRY